MLKKRFILPLVAALLAIGIPFAVMAQNDTPTSEPPTEVVVETSTPAPTEALTPAPTDTPAPTEEATQEPTVPPPTDVLPPNTESPQDILGLIIAALTGGSATIAGSLFVTAVVGLLKMFIPSDQISGNTLKNVVSIATWIVYSLAIHFGVGTQFQGIAAYITPILVTAAPLVGVLLGSHGLYHASVKASVPILGYQRPASKPLG